MIIEMTTQTSKQEDTTEQTPSDTNKEATFKNLELSTQNDSASRYQDAIMGISTQISDYNEQNMQADDVRMSIKHYDDEDPLGYEDTTSFENGSGYEYQYADPGNDYSAGDYKETFHKLKTSKDKKTETFITRKKRHAGISNNFLHLIFILCIFE